MIAILKINSADIINEIQSDTLALCIIPSNSIKYKLSQLPIMKELINQPVDVIEEPDPIDPADYIFIDDVPEFFWKFIKYALSKPANINPDSYLHLCNLLLATPNRPTNLNLYDFTLNENLLAPYPPGDPKKITFGNSSYEFQTYSRFMSTFKIYPKQQNITIQTVFYTSSFGTNRAERIWEYLTPTSYNNGNMLLLDKRNTNTILAYTRSSTVSGYGTNLSINLATSATESVVSTEEYPTTVTAIINHTGTDTTTSAQISLRADFAINYGSWFNERAYKTANATNLNERIFLTSAVENIGSYAATSGSTTTNQIAIPNIISHKVWIEDLTNLGKKNLVRYIDFDKTKIINEKLMMIV